MKRFLLLAAFVAGAACAQDTTPPAPCENPEYRAFDFWIGEWNVTQNDQPAGHNRIEAIDGGCAISESWTSASGKFSGHSLNFYDRTTQQWHQVWVDSSGTVLRLTGGLQDSLDDSAVAGGRIMVLQGSIANAKGGVTENRITWTPATDGSVRQHWETSEDGVTWTTAFDGHYVRAEEGLQ
jgi:hypothetical protein